MSISWKRLIAVVFAVAVSCAGAATVGSQTREYPKEIRGYKVERTVVEVKKVKPKEDKSSNQSAGNGNVVQTTMPADSEGDVDELIQLGKPEFARFTPLGITFEIPIVVSAVKQSGHVEFLVFEDMVVNGTSVYIDEYHREFDLPNKQPLTLDKPLRINIFLPSAVLAAIGDWNDSKETWQLTGRVYVFGKFKKSIFSFKRVVPIELRSTMRNPLRDH